MLSTPFDHEIYLGFPLTESLETPTYELTFIGGHPVFLTTPDKS